MSIGYEVADRIATITLDRQRALNAMDTAAYRDITEALARIDADPEVRVGIITGAGDRAFSAGADLKEMHSGEADADPWRSWRADRWDLGLSVTTPLIAAIDGYALAGGLELALKCDIRIATARSEFGAPEVKWNLLHGFGALRLPAVVGLSDAMLLLLTGEFVGAEEALRIGLISRIVDPSELMPEAKRIGRAIAANAPDAVHMTKELALSGLGSPLEQGLRLYHAYMEILEGNEEQAERLHTFSEHRQSTSTDG